MGCMLISRSCDFQLQSDVAIHVQRESACHSERRVFLVHSLVVSSKLYFWTRASQPHCGAYGQDSTGELHMSKTQQVSLHMSKTQQVSLHMSQTQQVSLHMSKAQQVSLHMGKAQHWAYMGGTWTMGLMSCAPKGGFRPGNCCTIGCWADVSRQMQSAPLVARQIVV